jgi:8-oxo-dGTP pyrophosphatase MutT (NUDIX family)
VDLKHSYQKVQVWVIDYDSKNPDQSQVLCLKTNEKRGLFWQPITGSVDEGEPLKAAAIRETYEETGIIVVPDAMLETGFSFTFLGKFGQATEFVFCCVHPKTEIEIDPNEHIQFQWFSASEALDRVKYESNRQGLSASLECLKNKAEDLK